MFCNEHALDYLLCNTPSLCLQFYSMVERDPTLMQMMKRDAMSVFAPTNRAFQSFTGNLNVLYHVRKYSAQVVA